MSSDSKVLHRVIRRLAGWAVWSFFTEVHIIGGENVPRDGPLIVTATHHNMMLDPAVLSSAFPHKRILHYWSKASLFANPLVAHILYSSGNIPVDRKSKDRQGLFKGTFDALSKGFAVALFPEGTSYTEPRIMQVKDGAAWAALEYTKWARENPDKVSQREVSIVPAAIVYTEKSKYRSDVIMEFGQPISMDAYIEQFLSDEEGAPRAAVKRLTRAIEVELMEATINAPDWDTLYTARMARDLMWEGNRSINLDDFVLVSQTLVDLFSTADAVPNFTSVKRHLLEYYSLLQTTKLTNSVLSTLPLPRTLDPNHPTPLPSRLRTLLVLIRDSISILVRLPFFAVPLIIHTPVYVMGRMGARLVEDEEETQAQNKVVIGLLLMFMIYPATFFFLWAMFWYTRGGALLAAGIVWLFALYHTKMINDTYEHAKRVTAAWRVLLGVWAPKRWELSIAALSQYTTPLKPNPSPWIDRPLAKASASAADALPPTQEEPPVKTRPKRRPPSRRIMRHVLRARAEAVRALASFFDQLEKAPDGKRVRASAHLARAFGGTLDEVDALADVDGAVKPPPVPEGWRSAQEVVAFLKKRGAKIASLEQGIEGVEGEWAALSSDGEMTSPADDSEKEDDIVWVPPSGQD
ncbi:hypothetical protein PLICRDRAFT_696028 [Plicaturopsis crispa FD-325 SS-3]|nr:hypothetical protein PLICRDRAFT_696028 [Plicaturopsis crispa FD-325 SS-3]